MGGNGILGDFKDCAGCLWIAIKHTADTAGIYKVDIIDSFMERSMGMATENNIIRGGGCEFNKSTFWGMGEEELIGVCGATVAEDN